YLPYLPYAFEAPRSRPSFPTPRSSDLMRIKVETWQEVDTRLSYGHVVEPGTYMTTITQPALYFEYLLEQIGLLIKHHEVECRLRDRKSTRLNSRHLKSTYAVCCLNKNT